MTYFDLIKKSALILLQQNETVSIEDESISFWLNGNLVIFYQTPSQQPQHSKWWNDKVYNLGICSNNRLVFYMEWMNDETISTLSFFRGSWENQIHKFASQTNLTEN